jgi:hypothetical protein
MNENLIIQFPGAGQESLAFDVTEQQAHEVDQAIDLGKESVEVDGQDILLGNVLMVSYEDGIVDQSEPRARAFCITVTSTSPTGNNTTVYYTRKGASDGPPVHPKSGWWKGRGTLATPRNGRGRNVTNNMNISINMANVVSVAVLELAY